MWKLLNQLFGWHYVHIVLAGDGYVCRVKRLNNLYLIGNITGEQFLIAKDGKLTCSYSLLKWDALTWEQEN